MSKKEDGMYFSEMLELNYNKFIKFKDIFDVRIKYTQEEISKVIGEFDKNDRAKSLKAKRTVQQQIYEITQIGAREEFERMSLIPKCLEAISKLDGLDEVEKRTTYMQLFVLEKYQLEEIYRYYSLRV